MFLAILVLFCIVGVLSASTINCYGGKVLEGHWLACDCSNEFRDGKHCDDELPENGASLNRSLIIYLITPDVLHPFTSERNYFGDLNVTSVDHQCAIGWNKNNIFISENRGHFPSERYIKSIQNTEPFIKLGICSFKNPFYMRIEEKNNQNNASDMHNGEEKKARNTEEKNNSSVMNIGFVISLILNIVFIAVFAVILYRKWKSKNNQQKSNHTNLIYSVQVWEALHTDPSPTLIISNEEDQPRITMRNCDNDKQNAKNTNRRYSPLVFEALHTDLSPTSINSNEEDQSRITMSNYDNDKEKRRNRRYSVPVLEAFHTDPSSIPINSNITGPSDSKQLMHEFSNYK